MATAAGPCHRVEVTGLACPFCTYAIEKQFDKIDGLAKIETDVEAGAVIVLFGLFMTGVVRPRWLLGDYRAVAQVCGGGRPGAAGLRGVPH
ncbi:heavy-metal-associated domain-containing protein [Arhodomonas sp. AD133]|uniref:heavy-metal-associated domain-containing protein n=1 Tax=Arhodomonas sp. AD133 TaxID=3415009 RepID=UPI003EBB4371